MTKHCFFTKNQINHIDYKDVELIRQFVNPFGRTKTRRYTGVCAKHQRELATAIKHARYMGFLPYIVK